MPTNKLKNQLRFDNIPLQTISVQGKLCKQEVSILRLDGLHEQVSGNKWFKLQYYLEAFFKSGKRMLATFGGAYSNHIAATAAACRLLSIPCAGFIRGDEPSIFSPTLALAVEHGMQLRFVDRALYKDKDGIMQAYPSFYWVPEGGYGVLGMLGAADIWHHVPGKDRYSHVVLPVGSGTTVAGLLNGSDTRQHIVGVSVMKNNFSLEKEIKALVDFSATEQLELLHDYHFGGYAKKTAALIQFMDDVWETYRIPLDFVYSAKAFYALTEKLREGYFPATGKILFIHTGGLQGNKSLPEGSLHY